MPVSVYYVNSLKAYIDDGHDPLKRRILREKFENGTSAAMNVDGSTTPVEFKVSAESGVIKEVSQVRFLLHGSSLKVTNVQGQGFGSDYPNGLSNGIDFCYKYDSSTIDLFLDPIIRLSDFYWYDDGIQVDIKAIDSQTDLFVIKMYLWEPVRLLSDTSDCLVITIQDDLTGLDRFEVMVLGSQEDV